MVPQGVVRMWDQQLRPSTSWRQSSPKVGWPSWQIWRKQEWQKDQTLIRNYYGNNGGTGGRGNDDADDDDAYNDDDGHENSNENDKNDKNDDDDDDFDKSGE